MTAIRFNEADHSYWLGDKKVPSVTQILSPLVDFSMVDPATLKAKQVLGTAVHLACELFDADDLDETTLDPVVAGYLAGWKRFRAEARVELFGIEMIVHSPQHGYAGTLDRVAEFHGSRWILDIKTSDVLYPSVGPQTAAYLQAYSQHAPSSIKWRRCAVQLREDGTYKLTEFADPSDWPTFLSCLTVHKFLERYK